LRREIRSFREALTVLGYEKLFRWLSLLMVTAGTSSAAPALARTAITRGFMAQNLATTMFSSDAADELFMVGAFSLLDAMFEMPKEAIFDKIMLPTPVKDAIMIRQGVYAPALDVVEWVERDCPEALPEKIIALNVSAQEITDAHLSALARAEQLSL